MNDNDFKKGCASLKKSAERIKETGQKLATAAIIWGQTSDNAPARAHNLLSCLSGKLASAMVVYLTLAGFTIRKTDVGYSVKVEDKTKLVVPAHTWLDSVKQEVKEEPFNLEKFLQKGAKKGGVEIAVLQAYIRTNNFANEVAKLKGIHDALEPKKHADGETPMAVKRKAKAAQETATV